MAKHIQLKAIARSETGRAAVKRLRTTGVVPAVVYGPKTEPLNVSVNRMDLATILQHGVSGNVLIDLQVEQDGKTANRLTLIQDVQQHPIADQVLHVDFREVSATETMTTWVPVRPIGEPDGVKNSGGTLEFAVREIEVECLPQDLPEVIEVNVEALRVGESISLSELPTTAGVTFLGDPDMAIFTVAAQMAEEEAAAPTEPGAAEPEVIGGKKPEAGEEGAKPEAGKEGAKPEAGKEGAKGDAKKA